MKKKDLFDEAQMGQVMVDGVEVKTFKKEITDCNIIEVEVGTTGYRGGDSGHGGRTYLRIKDLGGTDMSCQITGQSCGNAGQIEISLGGDAEMGTFIEALEFAADVLKEQAGGRYTMNSKERRQSDFRWYLQDVIMLYMKTGKLNGISDIRGKYKVSAITMQQFFECGLHQAAKDNVSLLDKEFCNKVYEYVLDRTRSIPAPQYSEYKKGK